MAGTPFDEGKRLMRELKRLDDKLAAGELVEKAELDSLLARLNNVADMAIAYGAKIPLLGSIGGMTAARIYSKVKQVKKELDNPKLFRIEGGYVQRVTEN